MQCEDFRCHRLRMRLALLAGLCCAALTSLAAGPAAPRIVSLSPHITELLFAAGAGDRVVGVDSASDFPRQAQSIPHIGDAFAFDGERILALQPSVVVYWRSGTAAKQQQQLRQLGLNLYGTEQRHLADIETTLLDFGRFAATKTQAQAVALQFHQELNDLRARYARRTPLDVFYQVWDRPLYTLSGQHVVSEVLDLCGGRNVFAELKTLAPVVDVESVLRRDPDVILIATTGVEGDRQVADWRRFVTLKAVRSGNIHVVDPTLLNRMTPRILQGAAGVCQMLDQARRRVGVTTALEPAMSLPRASTSRK